MLLQHQDLPAHGQGSYTELKTDTAAHCSASGGRQLSHGGPVVFSGNQTLLYPASHSLASLNLQTEQVGAQLACAA